MRLVDTDLKLKQSSAFGFNPRATCQAAAGAASFGAAEAVTPAARQQTRVYLSFMEDLCLRAVFMQVLFVI